MIGNKWERVCVGGEGRKEEMSKSERERNVSRKQRAKERETEINIRESDDLVFCSPSSHSPAPSATVVLIHWLPRQCAHTDTHQQFCSAHPLLVKYDIWVTFKYTERLIDSGEETPSLIKEGGTKGGEHSTLLRELQHMLSHTFSLRYSSNLHQMFLSLPNSLQCCYYLLPSSGWIRHNTQKPSYLQWIRSTLT